MAVNGSKPHQTSVRSFCRNFDQKGQRCLMQAGHSSPCLGSSRQMDYFQYSPPPLPQVLFRRLEPGARRPTRAYPNDAGWDLYALCSQDVPPDSFVDIHTGVAIATPPGMWARVVGRSSTVRNHGLMVIEGVVDTGWRGELFFGVRNLGPRVVRIMAGDRLAQVILQACIDAEWEETEELPPGTRGESGFGSSGR